MDIKFLSDIGQAFIPKKFRPNLRNYLMTAGIDDVPYHFFGGLFFTTIFLTIVTYFGALHKEIANNFSTAIAGITAFSYIFFGAIILSIVVILLIYFYLNIKIYNRTKALEDKLVDYLTLVSTNLKGGLSFEKCENRSNKNIITCSRIP